VQIDQINRGGIVERYMLKKIWFNKRTHPNEQHRNGHQLSKWALGSDQSSARSWPCAAAGRCAGRGCALIRQLANNNISVKSFKTINAERPDNLPPFVSCLTTRTATNFHLNHEESITHKD